FSLSSLLRTPPSPPRFPYTTLFRSRPFSPEQERALINLRHRYEGWIEAERELASLPYDLRRKKVGQYEYLYEIFDRSGNGKSLRSEEHTSELQSRENLVCRLLLEKK